jgi:hypothetical protein
MVLLVINPLSKSVAISEILILIALFAIMGWLLGRWTTRAKIRSLRESLILLEVDLDQCQSLASSPGREYAFKNGKGTLLDDNLRVIEGIGPQIEGILKDAGITNLDLLSQSNISTLTSILQKAGRKYQIHDPTSWPEQAALARDGMWDKLGELQEKLVGGRHT